MKRPTLIITPTPAPPSEPTLPGLSAWAAQIGAAVRMLSEGLAVHAAAIKQLWEGQSGICGSVTLTANATTTTVTNSLIPAAAVPQLTPASGTWASTVMRVTTVAKGSFIITHSNEAATDRVVYWFAPTP